MGGEIDFEKDVINAARPVVGQASMCLLRP